MVFSSLTFLFLYLPLTLLVYFLSPLRWRNFVRGLIAPGQVPPEPGHGQVGTDA